LQLLNLDRMFLVVGGRTTVPTLADRRSRDYALGGHVTYSPTPAAGTTGDR